ncbi:MAG TPA: hypothetical protein VGC79_25840 [Polyangiaceae bacterium]
MTNRLSRVTLLLTVLLLLWGRRAGAWIYPEHRDIANRAVGQLSPEARAALEQLWAEARANYPSVLCEKMAEGEQGVKPACVDFAAWPALAGDHSCSPRDLVKGVLPSDWVLAVSAVAAETKVSIAEARSRESRNNRLATSNLRLQTADPEYASRAQSNIAHFLLPRTGDDVAAYTRHAMQAGSPLNALGLYVQQHLAALTAAQRFASLPANDTVHRAEQARLVFALEAYAIHWLEDIFAAGHVAGTWGATAWRKGTHDYYNEFGFDGKTWGGTSIVIFGDANMKAADLQRAAAVVSASLEQLARALTPGDQLAVATQGFGLGPEGAYVFDACRDLIQPPAIGGNTAALIEAMRPILLAMPVPGRGEGDAHLPRFREELGPFVGVFGALGGGVAWGGLASSHARGRAALAAGLRLGFGAESLTGTPGTATAFIEGGLQMAAAESSRCEGSDCALVGSSNLFPTIPSRTGLRLGLRLPFWLIPGDTILLIPILAIVSPGALNDVGVAAASGGLIPYERTLQTGAGAFQVVLGREVTATLYGALGDANVPLNIAPIGTNPDGSKQFGVVAQKSVAFELPVVEWTPFREFATQLTFAACVQLGFGFEVPYETRVMYPEGAASPASPVAWNVFLRGQFDGRYFLGNREDLQAPH